VQVLYDSKVGYAFDGFLSTLPIPDTNLMKNAEYNTSYEGKIEDNPYRGQEMEVALNQYIKKEFYFVCDPVEYYNGSNGEGFEHLDIQKMNRGFTKIIHGGLEGMGTELLLPKIRLSEVKNLIILLAQRSG
jgi:hypothetical protein